LKIQFLAENKPISLNEIDLFVVCTRTVKNNLGILGFKYLGAFWV